MVSTRVEGSKKRSDNMILRMSSSKNEEIQLMVEMMGVVWPSRSGTAAWKKSIR